jgi:hypothetical protein
VNGVVESDNGDEFNPDERKPLDIFDISKQAFSL